MVCNINDLQEQTKEKAKKFNFNISKDLQQMLEDRCNFTDEELQIFKLRIRGWSVVRIAMYLQQHPPDDVHCKGYSYSVSKVESRIRNIKCKINALDF